MAPWQGRVGLALFPEEGYEGGVMGTVWEPICRIARTRINFKTRMATCRHAILSYDGAIYEKERMRQYFNIAP